MYQSFKKLLFLLLAFLVLQTFNSNAQKSSAEIFSKLNIPADIEKFTDQNDIKI
jgi:hypothetical protein